jgi:hypothetical protein
LSTYPGADWQTYVNFYNNKRKEGSEDNKLEKAEKLMDEVSEEENPEEANEEEKDEEKD